MQDERLRFNAIRNVTHLIDSFLNFLVFTFTQEATCSRSFSSKRFYNSICIIRGAIFPHAQGRDTVALSPTFRRAIESTRREYQLFGGVRSFVPGGAAGHADGGSRRRPAGSFTL